MPDNLAGVDEILLKLLVAALLGGLIGLEREVHDRPAGLRTHTLVCLGSAIYMMLSVGFSPDTGADPGRIAAQVATGIGFLGAGTIIRHGDSVRGLTTAASIWAVAAIGLCAGRGGPGFAVAGAATVFVLGTLRGLAIVETRLAVRRRVRRLQVRHCGGEETMNQVRSKLSELGVEVRTCASTGEAHGGELATLEVVVPSDLAVGAAGACVSEVDGVRAVIWE